jgi:hypothetical protein
MGTPPHEDTPASGGPRVITLASSTTPMPLQVPFVHELEGFTVFRSRNGEGDATLYHLHVGYFVDEQRAREALLVIRKHYAFAMIEQAPSTGLGSLDDTLNTDFEVLRSASARVVARKPVAARPTQHYAVLLVRRETPGDASSIRRLPAFRGFNVYAVRASHDGGECQDVRLGFFEDLRPAKQFADSIRSHFPQAAVLPVSERERARVTGLVRQRGEAARAGAASTQSSTPQASVRNSSETRSSAQTFRP